MTFLVIYCTILTIILVAIGYHKFFGKGKKSEITREDLEEAQLKYENLKKQYDKDMNKLQEAFSGKVNLDSVDDIIKSESGTKHNKRRNSSNK